MSQHGSVTPDPSYTGKTIPPIPDLHDSNGDGFWGPPIKVTDEAVGEASSEVMVRYRGSRTPDSFALEATRHALLAAVPHLQVQVDREALVKTIRDAGSLEVGGTRWPLDRENVQEIADAALALLSPEESRSEH